MLEGESVCFGGVVVVTLVLVVVFGVWEWEWASGGFCLSSKCERPSCSANTCSAPLNTRSA